MNQKELENELELTLKKLAKTDEQNLMLDLSRGKPSREQLELSMEMLSVVNAGSILDSECGMGE